MIFFSKYQSGGNDFVLLDDREQRYHFEPDQIRFLCHRRLGIGADGLVLLKTAAHADCSMQIFNADGSEPTMCGNGLACLLSFARRLGFAQESLVVQTGNGSLSCRTSEDRAVIDFGTPRKLQEMCALELEEKIYRVHTLHTGVPHAVVFADGLSHADCQRIGRKIRFHPQFSPDGVNVNFVSLNPDRSLQIRTYERGVEDLTLACGTGTVAAAWIAAEVYSMPEMIGIATHDEMQAGPDLHVFVRPTFGQIELHARAVCVFEGTIPEQIKI